MDALINDIYKIIRGRSISDLSALQSAKDIVEYLNDNQRSACKCPEDIKTGWIKEKCCNICGRPQK